MPGSVWRHLRWSVLDNLSTSAGMVLSAPGQLYEVRAVGYTAAGRVHLYDHTNVPQFPLLPLTPGATTPDEYPRSYAGLALLRGLYVSFSMGTGGMAVLAAWDRQ